MSCPDCFTGSVNKSTPTGSIETIHGLPTYIAKPSGDAKALVVIVPDAFGWDTPNVRCLADSYANNGDVLVYVPDFMKGTACSLKAMALMESVLKPSPSWFHALIYKPLNALRAMSHFLPFFLHNRPAARKSLIFEYFRSLRVSQTTSNYKIGVAGFCWGGKFTVLLCQNTPSSRVVSPNTQALMPLVDCGFTAHPSLLKVPADIEDVKIPLSICVGDNDMAIKLQDVEKTKEILEGKKTDGLHEVVIVPGAKHGFAIRGLLDDPEQKQHGDLAEKQAVAWFRKWLM